MQTPSIPPLAKPAKDGAPRVRMNEMKSREWVVHCLNRAWFHFALDSPLNLAYTPAAPQGVEWKKVFENLAFGN
jgi:hypothetical protein